MVEALEKDVGVAFMAVAELARLIVLQVPHSAEAAFSEHLERLTEQAG